jgi:hypothetical protein
MTKTLTFTQSCASLTVLLFSTAASAAPITYDFTGVGQVCGSSCFFGPVFNGSFSGTITIDEIAPGPSGDDVHVDVAAGYVSDPNGWVNSSYEIHWDSGSFVSGVFAGTGISNSAQGAIVTNGPEGDWMQTSWSYDAYAESNYLYWEQAQFTRFSADTSWLDDNSFRTDLELASGPGAANTLSFWTYYYDWYGGLMSEVKGRIDVQTLVARNPTPVPEPSTLVLLALGVLGAFGLMRRRVCIS